MQADYLIIGAGIAGTLLSYELLQRNKSVVIIDSDALQKASTVAGAILNPVNIKQGIVAKDYQLYIAQALETYNALQRQLNTTVISEKTIIAFDAEDKSTEVEVYYQQIAAKDINLLQNLFSQSIPEKAISPSYQINGAALIAGWRNKLCEEGIYLNEAFSANDIRFTSKAVEYRNIKAERIIFCEGAYAVHNPFFNNLPFTKNRGDALVISIPGLSQGFIYHNGIRLIPTGNQLFWCGSNYTWNYCNLEPDIEWRDQVTKFLQQWLKTSFTVKEHLVAERPTTAGQQPLMLMHESLSIAMFNGLGTKGFLMAPLLAKQFADSIITM